MNPPHTADVQLHVRHHIRLAHAVSLLVHPIAFPLVSLAAVAYAQTRSLPLTMRFVLTAMLLTSVPITIVVIVQVARGNWSDLDVSVRRQRYALYPFGLACMLALTGALIAEGAPRLYVRATLAIVVANIVDGIINLRYKVSAHATAAALCATVLWVAVPVLGVAGASAALAVGWSRVELGRHTRGQVVLGLLIGVASMLALLAIRVPTQLAV